MQMVSHSYYKEIDGKNVSQLSNNLLIYLRKFPKGVEMVSIRKGEMTVMEGERKIV